MTKILNDLGQEPGSASTRDSLPNTALTEEEFIDHCLSNMMGGWVPVSRYLKLYPEDSQGRIHSRVKQGGWVRGVHYSAPRGGFPWVNLPAIREWIAKGEQPWAPGFHESP